MNKDLNVNILKANYKYNLVTNEEISKFLENPNIDEKELNPKITRLKLLAEEDLSEINILHKFEQSWPESLTFRNPDLLTVGLQKNVKYVPNSLLVWIDAIYYQKVESLKYIIEYFEKIEKINVNFVFVANEKLYDYYLDERYSSTEKLSLLADLFTDHLFIIEENSSFLNNILEYQINNNIYTLIGSFAQKSTGYQKLIDFGATNLTINNLERVINEISNRRITGKS